MCAMLRAGRGGRGWKVGSSLLASQGGAFAVSGRSKKRGVTSEVGRERCSNVWWYLDVLYSEESDLRWKRFRASGKHCKRDPSLEVNSCI